MRPRTNTSRSFGTLAIRLLPLHTLHFPRDYLDCPGFIVYLVFIATMAHDSVEKKNISIHESDGPSKDSDGVLANSSDNDSRFDQALDFLKQHKNDAAVSLSRQASFTRALRRRVDFRVIPFLCCCYTLNFLDKVLLNVRNFHGRGGGDEDYPTNTLSMRTSWEWRNKSISWAMNTRTPTPTSG